MSQSKGLTAEQLFDAAFAAELVTKGGGGWLSIGEHRLGQGRDKSIQSIEENEELRAVIEAALKPKDERKSSGTSAGDVVSARDGVDEHAGKPLSTDAARKSDVPGQATIDLSFPLPPDIPHNALHASSVVVKSKSDKGFRRAGYGFSPEETIIPYADIPAEKLGVLISEGELIVKLRIARP